MVCDLTLWFSMDPYPTAEDRDLIAEMMEMPEKKVRVWFQNKRYKTEDGRMKCLLSRTSTSLAVSSPAPAVVAPTAVTNMNGSQQEQANTPFPASSDSQHCEVCQQNFTSATDHQIHMKRVHGSADERIVCKECLKTFDTLWNMRTHCIEAHMVTGKIVL